MKCTSMKMTAAFLLAGLTGIAGAAPTDAAITAFTSFENEVAVGGNYTAPGDGSTDIDLVNNPGQPIVDSTPGGSGAAGDLGFNARFETAFTVGLTGGEEVGVTNNATRVDGGFTDGLQGYVFSDTKGFMVLEFDPVSIMAPTQFEIDYFVQSTAWEGSDSARIFLIIDGATEVDLLNTTGSDIDNLDIEGRWITGVADLTGMGSSAVLAVRFRSNADDEALIIDRATFSSAVPEPASFAIIGTAAVAVLLGRRRHGL